MKAQVIFEDISSYIIKEISKAEKTIFIAVAWFTEDNIFDELLKKLKQGCKIVLLINNDRINNNSNIDYSELESENSKVLKLGNEEETYKMHNKFCIIDSKTIISGSFNWTYGAKKNNENIEIKTDAEELAKQYFEEFLKIVKAYYSHLPEIKEKTAKDINTRLSIIYDLIELEEFEDINKHLSKIKYYNSIPIISKIISNIEDNNYLEALSNIAKVYNGKIKIKQENYDDFRNLIKPKASTYKEDETVQIKKQIGQKHAGGIIFYIDKTGEHGLVCAEEDQGKYNWGDAKIVCKNLKLNQYKDWYLPSKNELNLMYENLHKLKKGNFADYFYWSSSEYVNDFFDSWGQYFNDGSQSDYGKYDNSRVRAVRAF